MRKSIELGFENEKKIELVGLLLFLALFESLRKKFESFSIENELAVWHNMRNPDWRRFNKSMSKENVARSRSAML